MYTTVERRKINAERLPETLQRAQSEFFPHLQQAPGFTGFYLVADQPNGINTAILVWESKEHADAFERAHGSWRQTLEELGHTLQTTNSGETMVNLEPQR